MLTIVAVKRFIRMCSLKNYREIGPFKEKFWVNYIKIDLVK